MSAEEEEAGVHAANARALQEECQAELNQAMPALHGESLVVLLRVWTRRCAYIVRACICGCMLYVSRLAYICIQRGLWNFCLD